MEDSICGLPTPAGILLAPPTVEKEWQRPCRLDRLDAYDAETGSFNTIIETPKGNHNKYKCNEARRVFSAGKKMMASAKK